VIAGALARLDVSRLSASAVATAAGR
jgi:hypothetical protein